MIGCKTNNPLRALIISANYGNPTTLKSKNGPHKNGRSIALVLRHRGTDGKYTFVYLTGDLTRAAKDYLAKIYTGDNEHAATLKNFLHPKDLKSRYTVLKVSHHASVEEQSQAWLDLVEPDAALISAGLHQGHGHPSCEVIENLNTYIQTRKTLPPPILYNGDQIGLGLNFLRCFNEKKNSLKPKSTTWLLPAGSKNTLALILLWTLIHNSSAFAKLRPKWSSTQPS